jgi:class 3 adenylate cyclase
VRGGLAIVEAIAGLGLAQQLQVRIGIATGLVVVGDLIGTGAAQEQTVTGETPNLAARLQTLAAPNAVIASHSTRRQLGTLFEMQDLGPQVLKGFAGEPLAWRVVGESGVESRFAALPPCAPPKHHWSAARKNSTCCCGAGPRLRAARAGSCCCRPKRASASRG